MSPEEIEKLRNEQNKLPKWGLPEVEGENWEKAAEQLSKIKKDDKPKKEDTELELLRRYVQQVPRLRYIPPISTQQANLNVQKQIQDYYKNN